jgi:hypothetical protein
MKKLSWNSKLFNWFLWSIIKYPENRELNKILIVIRFVLMPLDTLYYMLQKKVEIYDYKKNQLIIYGQTYSPVFFQNMLNVGKIFRIVEVDGYITVESIMEIARDAHKGWDNRHERGRIGI